MYNVTNGGVEGEENFGILSYCAIYANHVYLFIEQQKTMHNIQTTCEVIHMRKRRILPEYLPT